MNRRFLILCSFFVASCFGALPAQDDPASDGWTTEAISNSATAVLKKIGKTIVKSSTSRTSIPIDNRLVADTFSAFVPDPDTIKSVYRSGPFDVRRSSSSTRNSSTRKLNGFPIFLTWIADSATSIDKCEFKIIGIERQANQVITQAKVALHGTAEGGILEQNQDWLIVWQASTSDLNSVTLSQIRVTYLESTRLTLPHGGPLFVDETSRIFGAAESYRKQLALGQPHWLRRIESVHGMLNPAQNGMSIGDVNNDGYDDLYVCQPGGLPNRMYIRERSGQLRDISKTSGTDLLDNTHAALWIDFDNDGDQDLIASTAAAVLLFEQFSPLRFRLKIALDEMRDCYSLAATDFDSDGDLDVYACGYFPSEADVQSLPIPVPYFDAKNGGSNYLIRNEGDWKVNDATAQVGLNANNNRFSYAAIWIDHDQDGDQDLYVANDFGRDNLFENQTVEKEVQFVDVSQSVGLNQGAFGMSVSASDLNRDGFDDLYVANMYSSAGNRITTQTAFRPNESDGLRDRFRQLAAGNSLLINRAGKRLENEADSAKVDMGRWSWGANFVDINNDGLDDLLVTNGYITGTDPDDL